MKKDSIVHFVGFITALEPEDFAPNWERYARRLVNKKKEASFHQLVTRGKNKLDYLSQHEWDDPGSNFSFMNERRSDHFPEHNVRVVQLGGYLPGAIKHSKLPGDDTRIVVFLGHEETDIDFYRKLSCNYLLVNQAYYESCLYGHILEFFVANEDAEELSRQLKQRPYAETGIYRECLLTSV